MTLKYFKLGLLGLLIATPLGCNSQAPNDTATPQERIEVNRNDPVDANPQQDGVDVQVGGGEGVDVQTPGTRVEVGGEQDQ
jgi:hypothetical protein